MKKELTLLSTLAVAALVLAGCAADDGSQPSATTTVTVQADGSTDGVAQASLLESFQAAATVHCANVDLLPGLAVLVSFG